MRSLRIAPATVLFLLVLGLWTESQAAQCNTTSACVPTSSSPGCDLRAWTSWTCGHAPRNTDRWNIRAGHTAIVEKPTFRGGLGTIHGSMLFDAGPSGRDGD